MLLLIFLQINRYRATRELFLDRGILFPRMRQECIFEGEASRKSRYLCIPYFNNITLFVGLTIP